MKVLKAVEQESKPVPMSLLVLYPLVAPTTTVVDRLKESILKEGLRDPIVVAKIQVADWRDDDNPDINEAPSWLGDKATIYRIQMGNNRAAAAKALGYDAIDCIIVNSIEEACAIGHDIRRKNKQWIADIER